MAIWNSGIGTFLRQETTLFEVMGIASSDGQYISTDNRFPVDATFPDDAVIGISSGTVVSIGNTVDVTFPDDAVVSIGNTVDVNLSAEASSEGSDIISRINISRGAVTGYSHINKFGYREIPSDSTAYYTLYSAYDKDDTGSDYLFPTAASTAAVSSSNGGEDNGGTVKVDGLDINYNEVTETITVGQTGSVSFFRVHRAKMVTAGAGNDVNEGNITVTVDGKSVAYIPAGYGQTLQCVYTIPAGKTGYLFQVDVGVDEKEKPVKARVVTRDNTVTNPSWQTKAFVVMESNFISFEPTIPPGLPEKTDIKLEANVETGDIEVSGGFDLVLRDD